MLFIGRRSFGQMISSLAAAYLSELNDEEFLAADPDSGGPVARRNTDPSLPVSHLIEIEVEGGLGVAHPAGAGAGAQAERCAQTLAGERASRLQRGSIRQLDRSLGSASGARRPESLPNRTPTAGVLRC
jgi:hypothetical protein